LWVSKKKGRGMDPRGNKGGMREGENEIDRRHRNARKTRVKAILRIVFQGK